MWIKAVLLSGCLLLLGAFSLASTASATPEIKAEAEPATVTITDQPISVHTDGGTIECSLDFHEKTIFWIQWSMSATYTNCKAFGFISATVTSNECLYVTTPTEKVEADSYRAHLSISCPAGKAIVVTSGTCEMTIGSQSGLTTVDLVNDTSASPKKDITFRPTVKGLAYTVTKDGFACPFTGTGATTNGEITSSQPGTLTAFNSGNQTGIQIVGE